MRSLAGCCRRRLPYWIAFDYSEVLLDQADPRVVSDMPLLPRLPTNALLGESRSFTDLQTYYGLVAAASGIRVPTLPPFISSHWSANWSASLRLWVT